MKAVGIAEGVEDELRVNAPVEKISDAVTSSMIASGVARLPATTTLKPTEPSEHPGRGEPRTS